MKKKILGVLICLAVVISMMPNISFAGLDLRYEVGYKVFPADVADKQIAAAFTGTNYERKIAELEVESLDNDDIADLSVDTDYKAVIYLKGAKGESIRSLEFTAKYDPTIMINSSGEADIEIKGHSSINKYFYVDESIPGKLHYSFAMSSVTPDYSSGLVPIAAIDFKLNSSAENIYADSKVSFDFEYDGTVNTAYVGTMITIHKIPLQALTPYIGSVRNPFDGVKLYDYAYAPEDYKLAIIADEHEEGKTLVLDGGNIPVFYTTNEVYLSQSTNSNGRFISAKDNELKEKGEKQFGVYLAFVKEVDGEPVNEENFYNIVSVEVGENKCIGENDYLENIDLDGEDGTQVNDASLVYQMLREFMSPGQGSHWGYEPNDGSFTLISAYQRLLAENDHDGKLYGTIEDVNSILNIAIDPEEFEWNY